MILRRHLPVVGDAGLARRDVMAWLGLGTGSLLLSGLLPRGTATAQAPVRGRKFVFAYFDGGWDILLGLDPRDPATTNPMQHQIDPAYDQLDYAFRGRGVQRRGALAFGPAVPPALLAHAQDLSIVNGITMDTAAHEVGRRYFITGRFPRGLAAVGSSTPAEIVAQMGEQAPIAHLSARVEAYASGLPAYASALSVNGLGDLLVALTPIAQLDPEIRAAVEAFQDAGPGCEGARMNRDGLVAQMGKSVQKSRDYLKAQLGNLFDIARVDPEMSALKNLYGVASPDPAAPEVLALVAGQALKNDVCQCVSVGLARDLDTHANWAQDQAPRQERGWKALAALITDLKAARSKQNPGRTVFDETTILAFSEFGRTPLFNTIRGRDHFLGNSALVAGAGLRRGVTVGRSAAVGMMPVETDLATGLGVDSPTDAQRAAGVEMLTPKHVLATLLASANLDYAYLRVPPIKALLPG